MMKCPRCKHADLTATKLDDDLPAHGCGECGGAIISLLYYREWAERTMNDQPDNPPAEVATDSDNPSAITCPKCAKLMTKFTITGSRANRLDLCGSCDEAWLDDGEWELLKALQLTKNIPAVFTDAWQRKVRKDASVHRRRQRLAKVVNEADIQRADDIRSWLSAHDKRAEILFYITQE